MQKPSNFDSTTISELLSDWIWSLKEHDVGALVVLGPDPFGDASQRLVLAVHPESALPAAKTLARSSDFGPQWRLNHASLVSWGNLERPSNADGQDWRDSWLASGYRSQCRISFELGAMRSFDCFMFSSKTLSNRSDAESMVWSALNIWPSLKIEIGQAITPLSNREVDCLKLAFVGLTSKQASEHLGLSVRTIEFHLSNAAKKLGVNNRLGAIQRSLWMGVL